jgi:hypothetical protein
VAGRDGEPIIGPTRRTLLDGTVIAVSAVRASSYPDGVKYSFQHFDPETGATLLRYDNAHDDPDLGAHHRHGSDLDPNDPDREVEFEDVYDHLRTFLDEVTGP